jgi:hypothetical protein
MILDQDGSIHKMPLSKNKPSIFNQSNAKILTKNQNVENDVKINYESHVQSQMRNY